MACYLGPTGLEGNGAPTASMRHYRREGPADLLCQHDGTWRSTAPPLSARAAGAWGAAVRSVPTCRANAQSRRDRLGVELPRRP